MAREVKSKRKRTPKSVLKPRTLNSQNLPVLDGLTSPNSQRPHDHAIHEFIEWYCSEPRLAFNKTVVTRYRISLEQHQYARSTINLRLAAVRRLAYEAADCGVLTPDLATGIRRVKGARRLAVRIGNGLTAEEGSRMIGTFGAATPKQRRNRAMIAVLIGWGLRRAEAAALKFEDVQLREEHWVIADLNGKAVTSAPFRCQTEWKGQSTNGRIPAGINSGLLFRAINKAGRMSGNGFTPKVIWSIVKEGAANCGLVGLAPHELRRTCARLCQSGRRRTREIQFLLGHVSSETTERHYAQRSVM